MIPPAISVLRILTALLASILAATSWAGDWLKTREGCEVWIETPKTNEVLSWSGQCIDGKAGGDGTLARTFERDGKQSAEHYVGEYENGRKNGQGTLFHANGSPAYEGGWKEGRFHGYGKAYQSDGLLIYEGNWGAKGFHGQGTRYYESGARYEGNWKDGDRSGLGVYSDTRGNRYAGEWREDLATGGTCHFATKNSNRCFQKTDGTWVME